MTKRISLSPRLIKRIIKLSSEIGNTPLIPIRNLHENPNVAIYAKAEWNQLSGSIKARAAFNIIKHAIAQGALDENKTLLDATSGNTGIAYATIGKELGIPVKLFLPENASQERKEVLKSLGAEVVLTSKFGGTDEAQEEAAELAVSNPEKYFYASQYTNERNWRAHYYGTAEEILKQAPDITHFTSGLGTTGTFTGTSRKLKEVNKDIQVISLQPDFALHGLEGWKHLETAIVPPIYDSTIADNHLEIQTERAYAIIKKYYELEGLLLSPSSAANIAGALDIANSIESGVIVTVLPDNAERYGELLSRIL